MVYCKKWKEVAATELYKRLIAGFLALVTSVAAGVRRLDLSAQVLGSPVMSSYSQEENLARTVWDMAEYKGVLYLGAGDYDRNTGPTAIWAYDLRTQQWSLSGTVPDEAVSRFCYVDGKLLAPGTDPVGNNWEYGDYHTLKGQSWETFDKLPGAVHNFDIAEFRGEKFFAIGTGDGEASPVLRGDDHAQVPFLKDGATVLGDTYDFTRVYDLFSLDDRLFCLFTGYKGEEKGVREFYEYVDGAFVFRSAATIPLGGAKQIPLAGKAEHDGTWYLANGDVHTTTDFVAFTKLELPEGSIVTDVRAYDSGVFALANTKRPDGTYDVTIWRIDGTPKPLADYHADSPAMSFQRWGLHFYVGFGGVAKKEGAGLLVRLSVFDRYLP